MSWLGSSSEVVRAAHPEYCFVPRIAALEASEPCRGAKRGRDAQAGIYGFRRDQSGDAHFMLHYTLGASTPGVDFERLGLWDADLSASADTRVVVSCVPDALIIPVGRALVARGRAANFRERCLTWEPRPGSVCASADPAVLASAAAAALPAGFLLDSVRPEEAALVDGHWRYRKEGTTVKMVEECVAARPSVCIREEGSGRPVCWSVLRPDCSWGLLFTLPEHRRRGLSKAAMLAAFGRQRAWAQSLQDEGERALACAATPYVHIAVWNEASAGLFRSLDFAPTSTATWVISTALAPRFTLRPLRLGCAEEVQRLLAHINTSYRQDDAFFVDQERTTLDSLLEMAKEGVFFVGFALLPQGGEGAGEAGGAGWGSDAFPLALPSNQGDAGGAQRPPSESDTLVASAYIKIISAPPAAVGGTAQQQQEQVQAQESGVLPPASPFASDSRKAAVPVPPAAGAAGEGIGSSADGSVGRKPSGEKPAGVPLAPALPGGATASFSLLTINPAYKKLGVAQRVLDFCMATSRDTYGAIAAEVFIVSVKPWLLQFYLSNGFTVVGAERWPEFLDWQLRMDCYFHQARIKL
jgi:GNAT superfamily N-acetyltransferase